MFYVQSFSFICIFCLNWLSYADEPSVERLMLLRELDKPASSQPFQAQQSTQTFAPTHQPIRLLLDVRSKHSDGEHNIQTLIYLAEKRHIDVLALNEHDRFTIRLGLAPIPWLIGYSQEHPSLYQTGIADFFNALHQAQQTTTILLLAGTESIPGYTWSGIPFKGLSLHGAERHIITLGANQADQIEALPSYSLKHDYGLQSLSLVFWFAFIFLLVFILLRKRKRGVALLLAGSFIAFMSTWLIKPQPNVDKDFINTAKAQDLFTIWAHPGTRSGVRDGPMGVKLNTPPYNKYIFEVPTDAFAAVYGDTDQNTVAGGLWDRFMMDYLHGYIAKPMWAVSAGDYHGEGQAGEYLGNFPMDIWAKSTSQTNILEALQHGRMTSWHMNQHQNIAVSALYLEYVEPNTQHIKQLLSGAEATVPPPIKLVIGLHEWGQPSKISSLNGHWIIDGKTQSNIELPIHDNIVSISAITLPKGQHVIRFQIPYQHGIRLETNPFLVDVR